MYLVSIKLDVLIIRWIRFDQILFSDIIIPRIPWSASSLGHVYNHSGILVEYVFAIYFKTCVGCIGLHSYNILSISVDQYVCIFNKWYTTLFCHLSKTEGGKYGNFLTSFKHFELEFRYIMAKKWTVFKLDLVITVSFYIFKFFFYIT